MARTVTIDNQLKQATRSSDKVFYFEWARCLAAIAVVFLHVISGILDNYTVAEIGTVRTLVWSEMQLVLTRWAVPVFLMITGALLLNPEKKVSWKKVGRYVKRMALVLCTFGLTFCLMKEFFSSHTVSLEMLGRSVLDLLSNEGFSHMWYVYALVGIYLLLPLFKAFISTSSRHDLEVLLAVLFAFTCIVPTLNTALGLEISTFIWLTSSAFYVFLGYYAHNYLELNNKLASIGLTALVVNIGLIGIGIVAFDEYWDYLSGPGCFLIAQWSLLVFLAFKRFLDRKVVRGGVISMLSELSFGIYILHPVFLNVLYKGMGWVPWMFPPATFEITSFIIAFIGSLALTWLLKRMPWVRTFI